jgi:hypothetical protein
MMSITFACGHCGKVFTLDDKFAGKKGKCKDCGALMLIPSGDALVPLDELEEREATPSSRGRAPSPRPEEPRRRPQAPAARPAEPKADVYGFDDDPLPPRSAVMKPEEDDFDSSPENPLSPRRAGYYDPPKKKKKSAGGAGSALWTAARIAIGLTIGLTGALVSLGIVTGTKIALLPNIQSSDGLEANLKERVQLHNSLADRLSQVNSMDEAQAASTVANDGIRAITRNLQKLKTTRALQKDIDSLKQRYAAPQEQAVLRLAQEFIRLQGLPGAWDALNVRDSIEAMAAEERSIPGLQQIQIPGQVNPPVPPPSFNPPTPPRSDPNPNNHVRPGNLRGGPGRSGPGGRPGSIGPG